MNKIFLGLALILSMNVGATTIEDTSKQVTTNNSQEVIAVNEQIEPSRTFTLERYKAPLKCPEKYIDSEGRCVAPVTDLEHTMTLFERSVPLIIFILILFLFKDVREPFIKNVLRTTDQLEKKLGLDNSSSTNDGSSN